MAARPDRNSIYAVWPWPMALPPHNARRRKLIINTCCKRRQISQRYLDSGFKVIDTGLQNYLVALSSQIEACYLPCHTSYLDAKGHWDISCYAELAAELPDLMAPGAVEHPPLYGVIEPLLVQLMVHLNEWWHTIHPEKKHSTLHRVQTFVTRYSVEHGKTHLTRHVDGPQVHASMILQLHCPQGFAGGGVTIWDRHSRSHFHRLRAGYLCMLDHCIWHQSHEVTHGERWVLVIFCQEVSIQHASGTNRGGVEESAEMACLTAVSLASRAAEENYQVDEATTIALMQMLRHGGKDERERAAFALGCLAANSSHNQALMVSCGVVHLLADVLKSLTHGCGRSSGTNECAWVVAALGRLASKNVGNKSLIASEGVIPLAVELLKSGNGLEKEEAASTLCNLAANHEGNKDIMISLESAPALLQLLRTGFAKQRVWAATVLSNLASGSAQASGSFPGTGL